MKAKQELYGARGAAVWAQKHWAHYGHRAVVVVRTKNGCRRLVSALPSVLKKRRTTETGVWVNIFEIYGEHSRKDETEFARTVADMMSLLLGYTPEVNWRGKPRR